MTVSSEITSFSYDTDGVTTAFPVPFYFLANQHLRVWLFDSVTEIETDLVLGSGYNVTGAGNPSGGTVTTTATYPAGQQLRGERVVPITQETAYQRNDPFPERAHERALDKLTMICQQLASIFGLLPGSTLRALLLGRNDVDGQGAYRARQNRIQDVGDPVEDQDATNRRWVSTLVAATAAALNVRIDDLRAYTDAQLAALRNYAEQLVAGVTGGYGAFIQSGVGTIIRTFQDKMRDLRSVKDHADASVTDFTTALNNATSNPEVVLLPHRAGGYPLNGIVSPHADATVLSLFSNPVVSAQDLEALNLLQFRGGYPCGLPVLSNMRDRKIEVVAGAIRQDVVDRTKWNYITSTYHRPTGILGTAAIAIDPFNIQVTYKKSYDEVIFFAAHPDEWMASRKNISVGTSVGQDTTEIQLGGSIEIYAELIFNAAAGTWAATGWNDMYNNGHVVPSWDAGTNLLTLTHDYCPELNIRVESIYPANCFAYRRSASAVQTVIGFHDANWNAIVPADTMRIVFTKVYNGPIQLDGSANSGTLGLHQGNIWFFGLFGRQ